MKKRILMAAIMIALFILVLWLRTIDTIWFAIFLNLIMLIATIELTGALKERILPACRIILILLSAASLLLFSFVGLQNFVLICVFVFMIGFAITTFFGDSIENISDFCLVLFYPIIIMTFAYEINAHESAIFFILTLICITFMTDTFAMFVGKGVGGKKLCPSISPNKTVSGAIGGLIGGIIAAIVLYFAYNPADYSLLIMLYCGVFGSVASQIGDLSESYIKRKLEIKDMSNLIPGHGGIMDRLDGMLFNLMFIYFLFFILL